MALALALLGIIVIGALVAGSFTAGRLEMTSGRNVVYSAQAAEAAEAGLSEAFVNWDPSWNGLAVLTPSTLTTSDVIPGVSTGVRYHRRVTKLSGNVFLVETEGQRVAPSGQVLASRSLGRLARTNPPDLNIQAAVTANDVVVIRGQARVDARNTIPTGWESACPAVTDTVSGIRTSGTVDRQGGDHVIIGAPQTTEHDGAITAATFAGPFAQFAAMANVVITGGSVTKDQVFPRVTGSPASCDRVHANNWGEPFRVGAIGLVPECVTYLPIVYYTGTGTLTIQGGAVGETSARRGQGILLSAGSIAIAGAYEFTGIILAMGSVTVSGTGAKVTGAILSGNANLNDDDLSGEPLIRYSSCAIDMALAGAIRGTPLAARNWIQRWQ